MVLPKSEDSADLSHCHFNILLGLQKVGPATVSIVSTLEPVMTVGLAYLFLGEHLTLVQTVGAAFVVLGALLAAWPRQTRFEDVGV
ncbi:EamA domain protein [Acididesulfobacillus acetoxydans]|uniref:Drug/metabolite transporter n=1 Tax=Acididesulfobacillus acetoxydans TaxID=1561005 RepID=A0A8S0XWR0_9FIRM|nr:DMT family transporter [Acididesulfobacillus acetoxydans]CAA7601197.1 EamA domain protein [Acididesulfobacillus acetoxydans]CEJ08524.1 Drug/metabolite transporter [Acididesulfobacillus acetoxydans]